MGPESEPSLVPLPKSAKAFEADLATDTWLERLREAAQPRDLGHIGPYELLEEVGRGRQGIVYRARQPGTERVIALKRLLAGSWADEDSRRRFAREIEATTALRHAAIVTVFAVDHDKDQPLLAMEWIDGRPVNVWARERPLDEILGVFLAIADGIRHAHQNGIIHRDLKPANILVDGDDRPRVLDFGLACIEEEGAATSALQTRSSLFVGTPAYAAPEQVAEGDARSDALTDLYSLGVVLYEMLTEELPYPLEGGLGAVFRAIETHEPQPPSSKRPALPRELDAIVLKALAKERRHRYQSIDAMQADVRRHLAGEPVLAHPPSSWYQLTKFVRRHRVATILGGIIVLMILGSGIAAAVSANRLAHERDLAHEATHRAVAAEREAELARTHAESERDRAAAVLDYLLSDVLTAAHPQSREGEMTISELVELAERAIDARFRNRPLDEAAIRHAIGDIYFGMGQLEDSEEEHRRALALRRAALPPHHLGIIRSRQRLARTVQRLGRYRDAGKLERETIQALEAQLLPDDDLLGISYTRLGRILTSLGRLDEADAAFARALALVGSLEDSGRSHLPDIHSGRASVAKRRGRYRDAEAEYRKALALQLDLPTPDPLGEAVIRQELATLLLRVDRFAEAESELTKAWESTARFVGPEHLRALEIRARLASAMRSRGHVRKALDVFEEALEGMRKALPDRHPSLIAVLHGIGHTLALLGRFEEAESRYREALGIAVTTYGEEHTHVATILMSLARTLADQRRQGEAEDLMRRALGILEKIDANSPEALGALITLGALAADRGHFDEAESCYRRGQEGLAKILGLDHSSTHLAEIQLALLQARRGRKTEARDQLKAILSRQRRAFSADHVALAETHFHLGRLAGDAAANEEAVEHLERAVALGDRLHSPGHRRWLRSRALLAENLLALDRLQEARTVLATARDRLSRHFGPDDDRVRQLATDIAMIDERQ